MFQLVYSIGALLEKNIVITDFDFHNVWIKNVPEGGY